MCDCLVALPAATGGATLFAKNSDRPPNEPQDLGWFPARRDTERLEVSHITIDPFGSETIPCLLSRPRWCWGAEHGVNAAGVAIGNEAIYTTLDPRGFPPALIGMDLVRLGLERATTARGAVELMIDLLERHGQGGVGHDPAWPSARAYWSSFLVADPHDAWVLETSGRLWATEQVTATRAISNRTTIPAFDAEHRHPRQPVERLVDPRLAASTACLATRPVTRGSLAAHLRSHDSGVEDDSGRWSVCMHVDGLEATTASLIAELPAGHPPTAWVLTGSPCQSDYLRIDLGELG